MVCHPGGNKRSDRAGRSIGYRCSWNNQSTGNFVSVGSRDTGGFEAGNRLAGPTDRRPMPVITRGRARATHQRTHRAASRSVFQRHQSHVDPKPRTSPVGASGRGSSSNRYCRLFSYRAHDPRTGPHHRCHECVPDPPLRHPRGRVEFSIVRSVRNSHGRVTKRRSFVWPSCDDRPERFLRTRSTDSGDRRRPTGSVSRPGWFWHGCREMHLRDRIVSPCSHRR